MTDRWNTPPEMTAEMRTAAYIQYVEATKKGYIAFQDIINCFRAAFAAKEPPTAIDIGEDHGKDRDQSHPQEGCPGEASR